jgi:nitrite reductase (NADH) small subunit
VSARLGAVREHIVCAVEDVAPGQRQIVNVRGRSLGVFNIDGNFHVLHNRCPHRGAPLCHGVITGTTLPTDGVDFQYGRQGEILRCPWHGWEFDLRSGRALADPRIAARTYPVQVLDGQVTVRM